MIDDIVKENIKGKQNKLIAGDNITIKDDVISATGRGGSIEQQQTDWAQTDESTVDYIKNKPTDVSAFVNDAGYLTEHQDISGKQDKLTAGSRITIEDNVISAQDGAASDVSYDNTRTGLSATNMQDAIDEMADTNLYETVVLTVGSADSSFNPVGQTITVTLEDGSATQYTVPISRQITFIVQRGMRYTISGTSTDDYRVLPISVKAAIPTRYLTLNYIPLSTGVFFILNTGETYIYDEYDLAIMGADTVGVMLVTSGTLSNGFGIVIAKDDVNTLIDRSVILQSISGTNVTSTTLYNGPANTQYGVAQSRSWATTCANNYKSIAGKIMQGYAGAVRDWQDVRNNIATINAYLALIGGTTLQPASTSGTSTYSGGDKGMVRADQYNPPYTSLVISMYYRPFYKYTL